MAAGRPGALLRGCENRLVAVPTRLGETFSSGVPEVLFFAGIDDSGDRNYDPSPDGQQFLLNRRTPGSPNPIVVVLGLDDWLRSRLAEGRQSNGTARPPP